MPVDLALPLISGGNGPNKNGRTLSARGAFLPGHIFDALLGVRRLTGGPPIISFSIPESSLLSHSRNWFCHLIFPGG